MLGNRLRLPTVLGAATAALALAAAAFAPGGLAAPRAGGTWDATAKDLRGQNGQRATYTCPAGGQAFTVWGTDVYTDDSSVCTAGVHAGLITFGDGGTVTIEIRPGQSSYTGTVRNGVTTKSYGSWSGSFVLVSGSAGGGGGAALGGSTWDATAKSFRGNVGKRYAFTCPAGGQAFTVWGSGPYTDDSSACTAGVHAGVITFAGGGTVTIQIAAGASSYASTARNGVTTKSYGAWGGSFTVVGARAAAAAARPGPRSPAAAGASTCGSTAGRSGGGTRSAARRAAERRPCGAAASTRTTRRSALPPSTRGGSPSPGAAP